MTCGVAKEYESPALPRLNAFPLSPVSAYETDCGY